VRCLRHRKKVATRLINSVLYARIPPEATDRVLIHVDTEAAHENLINTRLAYVSVSRAHDDAHIFTNDAASLSEAFSREVSKASALDLKTGSAPNQSEERANEERRTPHEPSHSRVERVQEEGQSGRF
jgi:hypothetical protein